MRHSDRAFVSLAVALLVAGGGVGGWSGPGDAALAGTIEVAPLSLPTYVHRDRLASGETLGELLVRVGTERAEVPGWVEAVRPHLDVRSLPVGLEAESLTDHHGTVQAVKLVPDWRRAIVLERHGDRITGQPRELPVERELVVVRGSVQSSLFAAVTETGEGDELALALADLFQWDIDFHREVRRGDSFALVFERLSRDGRRLAYGRVLAAEYVIEGKKHAAVAFSPDGGKPSYYSADGRPLKKQFLRAPLRFSRLSSRFSMSRLHPVLGRRLPHYGVDYAAPAGTPVVATADGTVSFMGNKGGGGNTVEIGHRNGYVTGYLHLSRYAKGLKVGDRVAQGEVIGYVGTTGLSTGPHLDYRVRRSGSFVNPLRVETEPAKPIDGEQLVRFGEWAAQVLPLLERPGDVPTGVAAELERLRPISLGG